MSGASSVKVVLVPVPEIGAPPGLTVTVHVPDDGKPSKTILPVATSQSGCVINPIIGASGVRGWVLITISADGTDEHSEASVTI